MHSFVGKKSIYRLFPPLAQVKNNKINQPAFVESADNFKLNLHIFLTVFPQIEVSKSLTVYVFGHIV